MSSPPRALPDRPSLRFLKLEAKRRCAAGEFAALHDAQAAIAHDHGLPDWAALKLLIADAQQESHALTQLRWIIGRFSGAGQPGWTAPDDAEMRGHFAESFLAAIPAERFIAGAARIATGLPSELTVTAQAPLHARVRIADLEYIAQVEPDPPHRITFLRGHPLGGRITDPRVKRAHSRGSGDVPAATEGIADAAFAELGLAGLITAGLNQAGPWVLARGWADLDRGEIMQPGQQFPATGISAAVTVTAVLRMVADGRGHRQPAPDDGARRAGPGGGHGAGHRLRRPARSLPAEQRRARRPRPDRRGYQWLDPRRGGPQAPAPTPPAYRP